MNTTKRFAIFLALLVGSFHSPAARAAEELTVMPLWPNGAPGFENRRDEPEQAKDYWVKNINNPTLTVFLPPKEKANGTAILIFPGGGFRELVYRAEGVEPAQMMQNLGVAAFVLKYRLPREQGSPYSLDKHPLQDGQRAMRFIRSHGAEWHIDTHRVGVLGFSAGGEMASLVSYNPGAGDPQAADPIDRLDAHPDFQINIYPGPLGVPSVLPADAPPSFFLVANDDESHVKPVLALMEKYRAAKLPLEVHLLARGGHGFNLGKRSKFVTVKNWPDRMTDWMTDGGWLPPANGQQ